MRPQQWQRMRVIVGIAVVKRYAEQRARARRARLQAVYRFGKRQALIRTGEERQMLGECFGA
jgi:hypothetical protein